MKWVLLNVQGAVTKKSQDVGLKSAPNAGKRRHSRKRKKNKNFTFYEEKNYE